MVQKNAYKDVIVEQIHIKIYWKTCRISWIFFNGKTVPKIKRSTPEVAKRNLSRSP